MINTIRSLVYLAPLVVVLSFVYAHSLGKARVVLEVGALYDVYVVFWLLVGIFYAIKFGVVRSLYFMFYLWVVVLVVYAAYYLSLDQEVIVFEFARSVRFIFYLLAFVLVLNVVLVGGGRIGIEFYMKIFYVLCVIFFVSYCYKYFILGYSRPWLFSENNFEMALLILVALFLSSLADAYRHPLARYSLVFIAPIVVLSFSKSAIIELFVASLIYMRFASVKHFVSALIVGVVAGVLAAYVVIDRVGEGGILEIDRLLFLLVFWDEYWASGFYQVLLGHGPAAELSVLSCERLGFWVESMFKYQNYCNAAIFHSLFMRLLFEYGVLVVGLLMFSWWYLLVALMGRRLGLLTFLILAINSMSVSGFSNGIVLFPIFYMALLFGVNKNRSLGLCEKVVT